MKRIFINSLILIFILITGLTTVWAQESTTLQFMKGMPQSDLQNPALHNDSSAVIIGFPGLSGMYFDFNSDFAVNDLIHKGTGALADSLVLDIDGFHSSLKATNSIQQNFSIPLFYLGIRSKKSFFSIGITEKAMTRFSFDKSLITFIKDGNAPYMGQNFDLGDLDMDAFHYREFAFGYSNELIKIENSFKPKKSEFGSEAFDMSLPTKIYLGGTYAVNNKINIGLLNRLYKNGNISENTVTLSANTMLGNFLSLTGSYSMIDKSTNNIGFGMAIRLGPNQWYLVSDNLLALNDPAKAEFVNLRFGMNLLFGRKHKPKIVETSDIQ